MWGTPAHVWFSVHNHGDPIPAAEQHRIFQPLERGRQKRSQSPEAGAQGLGLGLYICREIVRSHGGSLQVDSDAATGTTFSVSLPRARLHDGRGDARATA